MVWNAVRADRLDFPPDTGWAPSTSGTDETVAEAEAARLAAEA